MKNIIFTKLLVIYPNASKRKSNLNIGQYLVTLPVVWGLIHVVANMASHLATASCFPSITPLFCLFIIYLDSRYISGSVANVSVWSFVTLWSRVLSPPVVWFISGCFQMDFFFTCNFISRNILPVLRNLFLSLSCTHIFN